MTKVLDLDKFEQEKREIKLAGKKIDVTKIPTRVTLKVADVYDEVDEDDPQSFEQIIDLVMMIINSQNDDEDIDRDWIIDNTDITQMLQVIDFVMEPMKDRVEEENDTKN